MIPRRIRGGLSLVAATTALALTACSGGGAPPTAPEGSAGAGGGGGGNSGYTFAMITHETPGDPGGVPTDGDIAGAREPRVRWVVDPVDGTVNLLYGIPFTAVSVAAEVDGVVVAGAVHNSSRGRPGAGARAGARP